MRDRGRWLWLAAGLLLGALGAGLFLGQSRPVEAANDRFEDYVMCTGTAFANVPVRGGVASPTDGVWILDYRSGKLQATVVDRSSGKLVGWAEMDLVGEFGIPPRQNVHFLMTTGNISYGQSVLYVAETSTGKFGVYSLGPKTDGSPGVVIRRHDMVMFRKS
ncbi:MAG: hypothetical protein JO112_09615 [Planctomycetes bacterium]|nr:hypothetical protein [Planctomycetota bacterium]